MLHRDELKRYNRQIILPELGLAGQEKLKAAKVLMIGAGGLGCPVLQYLVAAGVGNIGIVDDDVVDDSNLHRQILYSTADVGKKKAIVAAEKLKVLNQHVELTAYPERLTPVNAANLIHQYNLIIDGSDNFNTRYLVNDTCVDLNKTLVFGSIFKFEGHVSVFNYNEGPDYRSIFPDQPGNDEVPNCAEIGVIGVLPGIIGTYMANEAIKIICGIGEILSGKLLTMNALDNSVHIFQFKKSNVKNRQVETPIIKANHDAYHEIGMDELVTLLTQTPDEVCLVDVREPYEYEDFNIGGVNIPLYDLIDNIDRLPVDKKIVFCCQTGQRSKLAITLLKDDFKGNMLSLKNGVMS